MPTGNEKEKDFEKKIAAMGSFEERLAAMQEMAKQRELDEAGEEVDSHNSWIKTRRQSKAEFQAAKKSLSDNEYKEFKKYRYQGQAGLKPSVYVKPKTYNLTENLEERFPKFTEGMSDHEKKIIRKRSEKIGEWHKKLQEYVEDQRRQSREEDLQRRGFTPAQIKEKEAWYDTLSASQKSSIMFATKNRKKVNIQHQQWRERQIQKRYAQLEAIAAEKRPHPEGEDIDQQDVKKMRVDSTSVSPPPLLPAATSQLPQNKPPAPSSATLPRDTQELWRILGFQSKEAYEAHERYLDTVSEMPPLERLK